MERPNLGVPGGHIAEFEQRDFGRDEVRSIDIIQNRYEIHPKTPDYASVPLSEAFDWNDVHQKVTAEYNIEPNQKLFVFAFYSTPNLEADRTDLDFADRMAFLEARREKPDDFLYYYRGELDTKGRVLSFCVWTDPEHASSVINGAWHQEAAKLAKPSYLEAHVQYNDLLPAEQGSEVGATIEFIDEHRLKVGKEAA